MAGRPPLPIGTYGEIRTDRRSPGWRARASFRDSDGVTREVGRTGRTKGAAKNNLLEALSDRAAHVTGEINRESKVSACAQAWLVEVDGSDRATQTKRRYRELTESYVIPRLGEYRIREVSVAAVEHVVWSLIDDVSLASARKTRDVLSQIFGLAVRHGAMDSNPVRSLPRLPKQETDPQAVPLELLGKLRTAIARWERGMPVDGSALESPRRGAPPRRDLLDVVDLLVGSAARIGELMALRWDEDVEFGDKVRIHIQGTVIYDPKSKPTTVRQEFPKTSKSNRRLVLPAFAAATLLRKRVNDPANEEGIVFPNSRGRWRDPGVVRKWLRAVRAEMSEDLNWITPHSFRRTVGTLVEKELGVSAAADQLGNDPLIAAKHYVQKTYDAPDLSTVLALLSPGEKLAETFE